jgi:hypothetical protein
MFLIAVTISTFNMPRILPPPRDRELLALHHKQDQMKQGTVP